MFRTPGERANAEKWLLTEPKWKNRVGKNWVAAKVLGQGGQGVVGLWTYDGPDKDEKAVTEIVVKQAMISKPSGRSSSGLTHEALALGYFRESGSPHIVKMYRHLYEERGNNSMRMDRRWVHRLFLEYCPGGDLFGWFQHKLKSKQKITEGELWGIFHCLARGALVMHAGTEDTSRDAWDKEIVHFDIKFENILLGATGMDNEHRDLPVFKFGDFGLSRDVPKVQDDAYQKGMAWAGTRPYYAPEQLKEYVNVEGCQRPWVSRDGSLLKTFQYGSHTNIWQIGLLMLCLKNRDSEPPWDSQYRGFELLLFDSTLSNKLRTGGLTIGTDSDRIAQDDENPKYSKSLRALIHECLLIEPPNRPTAEVLVARTQRGLESSRMAAGTIFDQEPDPAPSKPQLSTRWFSVGPEPGEDDFAEYSPPHTPLVSKLAPMADKAREDEEKRLDQEARDKAVWGDRDPNQQRSDWMGRRGSEQLPPIGPMVIGRVPSTPFAVHDGLQNALNDAMGGEIGKGLDIDRGFFRAGVRGMYRPPPGEATRDVKVAPRAHPNPPPPPVQEDPLPDMTFIVLEKNMFGGMRHRTLKVPGLMPSMTFWQVKLDLNKRGVQIRPDKMIIRRGMQRLGNTETLAMLEMPVILRVQEEA